MNTPPGKEATGQPTFTISLCPLLIAHSGKTWTVVRTEAEPLNRTMLRNTVLTHSYASTLARFSDPTKPQLCIKILI